MNNKLCCCSFEFSIKRSIFSCVIVIVMMIEVLNVNSMKILLIF